MASKSILALTPEMMRDFFMEHCSFIKLERESQKPVIIQKDEDTFVWAWFLDNGRMLVYDGKFSYQKAQDVTLAQASENENIRIFLAEYIVPLAVDVLKSFIMELKDDCSAEFLRYPFQRMWVDIPETPKYKDIFPLRIQAKASGCIVKGGLRISILDQIFNVPETSLDELLQNKDKYFDESLTNEEIKDIAEYPFGEFINNDTIHILVSALDESSFGIRILQQNLD